MPFCATQFYKHLDIQKELRDVVLLFLLKTKVALQTEFEVTNKGLLHFFLGLEIR